MNLKNKFVVVTGASTGIGQAAAVEFAKKGAAVALVGRSKDKLFETKLMIEKAGGLAEVFVADLSNTQTVLSLVKEISKKTNTIDVICNIAGIWHGEKEVYAGIGFSEFDPAVVINTINVGLTAPMLLVSGLLNKMPEGSTIFNLSGTFIYGGKGQVPYFVSKRAIEDFTKALSDDLKERRIYVNCLSPSDTSTKSLLKYFPEDAKEANTPEQVAKLVVNICSQKTTGKFWKIKYGKVTKNGYHK